MRYFTIGRIALALPPINRRVVLFPALVVALGLAFTGAASAQTATTFQASVTSLIPRPVFLAGGCSNGATFCGTANIAGYGAASWNQYVTSLTSVPSSCDSSYTATTYFTLASDGSQLALNEGGPLCAPGEDGNGYFSGGPMKFGTPYSANSTWTVDTAESTHQFKGMTGAGTDNLNFAGPTARGTYSGTLLSP